MNWAVLGAGSVAQRRVMPAISVLEGHDLRALMVRDQARADALAETHGASAAYASDEDLLADTGVDAVYVSSPVNLHLEHVVKVAGSGRHVLCEKPMAMTSAECEQMIRVCEDAGVTLGVCFVLRGWEIYQKIRSMIESEVFGTIVELRAHLAKWTPRDSDEWRLDPGQSGGGTLVDVATHYLDLFRYLQGEVRKIAYMGSSRVFEWPVEETAHTLIEFENGAHGSITASCTVPHGGNVLEIFGSKGSLFLGKTLRTVLDGEGREEQVTFPDYYSGILTDFKESIATGREPIASGQDGLRGLQVVEAAYASGRENRLVEL